ncbi:hypothetical protein Ciccas_011936, partial [Cichlidogyrus casuarinus]
ILASPPPSNMSDPVSPCLGVGEETHSGEVEANLSHTMKNSLHLCDETRRSTCSLSSDQMTSPTSPPQQQWRQRLSNLKNSFLMNTGSPRFHRRKSSNPSQETPPESP